MVEHCFRLSVAALVLILLLSRIQKRRSLIALCGLLTPSISRVVRCTGIVQWTRKYV